MRFLKCSCPPTSNLDGQFFHRQDGTREYPHKLFFFFGKNTSIYAINEPISMRV